MLGCLPCLDLLDRSMFLTDPTLCGMHACSIVWYLELFALHADPEKIVKGGGYWNSTLVGETEEQSGQKPHTVIVKLKVQLLHMLHVCTYASEC